MEALHGSRSLSDAAGIVLLGRHHPVRRSVRQGWSLPLCSAPVVGLLSPIGVCYFLVLVNFNLQQRP